MFYVCIYMYVYMYLHMYVYMYMCKYVYICMYVISAAYCALVQCSACELLITTNETHGCRVCFRFYFINISIRKSLNHKHSDISNV